MGRSVGPKQDGPGGRPAYMGENTGRGLAKSVGQFSSRDLPRNFGFPILRNRVPMGFGRSNLHQKMHNFKGFDFVHSKHFSSKIRRTKIELGACQPPTARAAGAAFQNSCPDRPVSAALLVPARDAGAVPSVRVDRPTRGFRPPTGSVAYADRGCKFGRPFLSQPIECFRWGAYACGT